MKTRFSGFSHLVPLLCCIWWGAGLGASAQTAPQLAIQTYAGLTITGAVGTVYSIEYVSGLANSDDPSAWRCLEFLQLPASPYLWVDRSAPTAECRFYRAVVLPAPTNMVFIPPGRFRMGLPTNAISARHGEAPTKDVIISHGFWMGKYEVTQGAYLTIMGNNPSFFNGDRTGVFGDEGAGGKDYGTDLNRPVEQVLWPEAVEYCALLTDMERGAGLIPMGCVYRLPTEAEWEYGCRAGTSTRYSYGDDQSLLINYAWYSANSGGSTHPVGQRLPNPWGLYDMHGNVKEWCQDYYGVEYPGALLLDPQGPASSSWRVYRGGGWNSCWDWPWWGCGSADRSGRVPEPWRNESHGFRVVMSPGPP
jgi:formylglycine-generating enzyme required for sulfatase activity